MRAVPSVVQMATLPPQRYLGVRPKRFKIFFWEDQICWWHGDGFAEHSHEKHQLVKSIAGPTFLAQRAAVTVDCLFLSPLRMGSGMRRRRNGGSKKCSSVHRCESSGQNKTIACSTMRVRLKARGRRLRKILCLRECWEHYAIVMSPEVRKKLSLLASSAQKKMSPALHLLRDRTKVACLRRWRAVPHVSAGLLERELVLSFLKM